MKIKRSTKNKIIGGVCGGLSNYFGINPWFFRLLFFLVPSGFWIYILMWIFFEKEDEFSNFN